MFGLRYRIEHLASRITGQEYLRHVDVQAREKLEGQVEKLTKALEWHVGVSLKVMNLEEELIMLRVAEAKKRGKTFGNQGDEVARQTCDAINQSVEQLNTDVDQEDKQG